MHCSLASSSVFVVSVALFTRSTMSDIRAFRVYTPLLCLSTSAIQALIASSGVSHSARLNRAPPSTDGSATRTRTVALPPALCTTNGGVMSRAAFKYSIVLRKARRGSRRVTKHLVNQSKL